MNRMCFHGIVIALCLSVVVFTQSSTDGISARAKQVHDAAIVVDSHDDTTQRLVFDKAFDIAARNPTGNLDIPRMRQGGLDGLFFSIWVPSDVTGADAVKRAMRQITSRVIAFRLGSRPGHRRTSAGRSKPFVHRAGAAS